MLHNSIGFSGSHGPLFGINALTLLSDAYNASPGGHPGVSYSDQIAMLQSMGSKIYRTSAQADADGSLSAAEQNKLFGPVSDSSGFALQTRAAGMRNLAVVLDRMFIGDPLWTDTNQACHDAGFTIGSGFVTLYGQYFDYYELSNEVTLFRELKLSPLTDGSQESHYDPSIIKVAHYIAGMNAGIKSVLPGAKTLANTAGYWRTYWMQLMLDTMASYGTDMDFVAWHWYNEMFGSLSGSRGTRNPIDLLYAEFGKPLWFTEIGARYGSLATNQQAQVDFYNEFMGYAKNSPKVFAVNWHELLDRPTTNYGSDEQNYGLHRFDSWDSVTKAYGPPTQKLLATQLVNQ